MPRLLTTRRLGLFALVIAAAVAYAWLPWVTRPPTGDRIFNSPDETANATFASTFARHGDLELREPLNLEFDGIVHPRAVAVVGDRLVPGSFIGLPVLYGLIGRLVGESVIVFLTPLVAALVLLGLWWLYRGVFGASAAAVAVVLVAAFPGWWTYAARSMFHNVLFVSLLAAAVVLWWRWLARAVSPPWLGVAAAVVTALALWVRPSESVWVLPALAAIIATIPQQRPRRDWWWVAMAFVVTAVLLLAVSWWTHGNPLGSGYALPGASVAAAPAQGTAAVLLPFGFHPRRAFNRLVDYTLGLFPWLLWPALVGWLLSLGRWHVLPRVQRRYLVLTTAIGAYLALYYGSWQFSDHLDPTAVTLGTSYIRYWLPLYLLALPYAALSAQLALQRWGQRSRRGALALLVALATVTSAQVTLRGGDESLTAVAARIGEYYDQRAAVLRRVEPNAVVVTERHDKVFFPTLAVVSDVRSPARLAALARLATRRPLYYYTWLAPHDVARVAERFTLVGLELGEGERIGSAETLYPLTLGMSE